MFEQIGTALLTPSDLLQAVITDLLFSAFNRIEQGRLISLLQACKRKYATGLFQQVCYSLTKWTGPLLYVNSLSQLGKINSLQQVCDISGRVYTAKFAQLAASLSSSRMRSVIIKPHLRCVRSACCGLTILVRISMTTDLLQVVVNRLAAMPMSTDLRQFDANRLAAMPMWTDLLQFVANRLAAMPMWTDLLQFVANRLAVMPMWTDLLQSGVDITTNC